MIQLFISLLVLLFSLSSLAMGENVHFRQSSLAAEETAGATTRFVSTENGIVDMQPTLNRIESGGSFPHPNDGSIFQNREGLLPTQLSDYYNEYVVPTPGVNGPGPMRIVTGQGGDLYFTPNHYQTFVPLNH